MRGLLRPAPPPALGLAAAVFLLATAPTFAGEADLHGKPLRGLTPVPLADVVKQPERFRGRAIRVTGVARPRGAGVALTEGGASLPLETESFGLPQNLDGAHLTAEGKLKEGTKEPVLVATGVEVRR